MNSLELMQSRLLTGKTQQSRMIKDKRKTLDRVLLYSYQGANVRKEGTTEPVRALLNPNSVKQDYDDKTISIGYEYEYKPGTVFEWVEVNDKEIKIKSKWLVYLQDLTELAYFKGDARKCSYEIKWKKNDIEYKVAAAVIGPSEASVDSTTAEGNSIDSPNHTLKLLLPASEEAIEHFVRYSEFYLYSLDSERVIPTCWKVTATDTISSSGIIELTAIEHYINKDKDSVEEGLVDVIEETLQPQDENIIGDLFIKPKKTYSYEYKGALEGTWWYEDTRLPVEIQKFGKEAKITWKATYTGQFVLCFGDKEQPENAAKQVVVVESLF